MRIKAKTAYGLAMTAWLGGICGPLPAQQPKESPAKAEPAGQENKARTEPLKAPEAAQSLSAAPSAPANLSQVVASGEISLSDAISQALEANPDLQSAMERTRIAEGALASARAQFYPLFGFNQEYQASDNPLRKFTFLLSQGVASPQGLFPLPGVADNFHTQLHLQHELYTGGLRQARANAAEAEREATTFSLDALRNRLVFQVAEAYYRSFQARSLLSVRQESVKQVESQLKQAEARFKAETLVRSEVLRVEVRLAQVREALITAQNAVLLADAVLENVMGARIVGKAFPKQLPLAPWASQIDGVEEAVAAATAADSPQGGFVETAVAEAVQQRPEVNEVQKLRQAAEHRVEAARASKRPVVGLVGDYDVNTGNYRTGNSSYFVGLAFSLNLFDGGRTRANVRQAEAQVREICSRHQRLKLDIELDVRKAYLQLKDARERYKVTEKAVSNAEESLKEVESRFRGEEATTTELLDSQVMLSDARVRSISVLADIEIARAALQRAVGRLTSLMGGGAPVCQP